MAALATTAAVVVALIGVAVAIRQVANERDARLSADRLRAVEERRAQAAHVSAWIRSAGSSSDPGGGMTVALVNASQQPIHNIVLWVVVSYGAGPQTGDEMRSLLGGDDDDKELDRDAHEGPRTVDSDFSPSLVYVLPPGRWRVEREPWHGWGMHRAPGVEVAFTDAAGHHWVRRSSGRLEETALAPIPHYGLPEPVDLNEIRPDS